MTSPSQGNWGQYGSWKDLEDVVGGLNQSKAETPSFTARPGQMSLLPVLLLPCVSQFLPSPRVVIVND